MPSLSIEDAYSKIFEEDPEEESQDFEIKEETSPQKKKRRKDKSPPKSNNVCIRPKLKVSEMNYFIFSRYCLIKRLPMYKLLSEIVNRGIKNAIKEFSEEEIKHLSKLYNLKKGNY